MTVHYPREGLKDVRKRYLRTNTGAHTIDLRIMPYTIAALELEALLTSSRSCGRLADYEQLALFTSAWGRCPITDGLMSGLERALGCRAL